ncbi:hypothetical protein IQ07DRAFT_596072 [Pyrenochaeta sp. DS3sAY3a]|nr:hypothetical protein IQ07DRAFT_596072 [Pyrenochaeta sp. DS3sAY3a]
MACLSFVLLVLLRISFSFTQDLITVSVGGDNSYLLQKGCVKNCIWYAGSWDDLLPGIGCSKPWVNECLCRADQAPSASKFLTTCVRSACGSTASNDISRAVSVYDGYCVGAGYTHVQGQAAPAETTPANSNPQAPTVTQVTLVTETARTSNAGSQSSTTPELSLPPITRHITSTIWLYPSETAPMALALTYMGR